MPRSVSFDVLAIDKASQALSAVAREVTQLDERIDRAGGSIEVDADAARAQEKLRAVDSQLARLNAKSFKVDADTLQAERQLQVLRAELERTTDADKRVKVEADIAQAQAKLRSLAAEKVAIDVDTGAAQAKLAALKASIGGLDRKRVDVDVDAAGALGKLAALGQQLRAVQTPVTLAVGYGAVMEALAWVQRLGAGLGSLGAVGIVSGGIAVAAFKGIGDALQETGEKAETGGAKVSTSASSIRSAVRQVESAQRDLRDANQNVLRSEETLADAQSDAKRAVESLDDARRAAIRTLEDYELRSKGMALSQESADLAVAEAQQRLIDVESDKNSSSLERARAELGVREAIQRRNEIEVEGKRLAEDKADADRRGVEQSDQVVSAQDRIEQANKRVEGAQRDLQKSHEEVRLATQRLSDSQLALQEAMHPPGGGGGTAVDKLGEAMDKLSPKQQEFVRFLRGLLDGELKELQQTSADSFLPGLQDGIQGAMDNLGTFEQSLQGVGTSFGDFFRDIGPSVGRAAEALGRLANLGAETTFEGLADAVNRALDAFTDWANDQSAEDIQADVKEIGRTVVDVKDTVVTAVRFLESTWAAIKFPVEVMRAPFDALAAFFNGDPLGEGVQRAIKPVLDFYETIRKLTDHIPGLKGVLPEVGDEIRNLGDAGSVAVPQIDHIGDSAGNTAGALDRMRDSGRQAADQFAGSEEANLRFAAAVDHARDVVQQNGATLDIHTQKGRDNRQALLDVASAANDVIEQMQNSGAPIDQVRSKFEEQRQKLIQQATQFGLTKTQAQTYIDKLLQVPKTVTTTATVNTAAALQRIQDLQNRLAQLNGALSVSQNTGKAGQGLGVYKSSGGWVGASVSSSTPFGGGPRGRDTVPGWLDPTEFVVRSEAARKWGPLLEQINAGADPTGAPVPTAPLTGIPVQPGAGAGAGVTIVHVTVNVPNSVIGGNDDIARVVSVAAREGIERGYLPRTLLQGAS